MLFSASDSARLNSRSPFPTARPASGSRLAPNTSRTISIRIRISLPLRLPSIKPCLLLIEALRRFTARRRRRGRIRLARVDVLQPALEFLDAFPDRRPDLRDALRAEKQHQDEQQDRNFGEA